MLAHLDPAITSDVHGVDQILDILIGDRQRDLLDAHVVSGVGLPEALHGFLVELDELVEVVGLRWWGAYSMISL